MAWLDTFTNYDITNKDGHGTVLGSIINHKGIVRNTLREKKTHEASMGVREAYRLIFDGG